MKRIFFILLLIGLLIPFVHAQDMKNDEFVLWENPLTKRVGYANSVRKDNATRWTVPKNLIQSDLIEVWGVGGGLIFNKKSISYVDWAIPAQYERAAKRFSENLSGVLLNGKVGFIDKQNRFIIKPQFDETMDLYGFSHGLAAVCINGKYGFINKEGQVVIEPIYEWADNFKDNLLASVKQEGKFGAIDITGSLVVPCKYKLEEAMINVPISNKEYRKAAKDVEQKKECGEFDRFLFPIDSVARLVNERINDSAYVPPIPVSEFIIREDEDRFGVVISEQDTSWILGPEYSDISVMDDGLMLIEQADSLMGVADYYGRIILPCEYNGVEYLSDDNLFIVQKDDLYGVYNRNGIEILPVCMDAIENFSSEKANIWINGNQGWVDTKGNIQEGFLDNVYRSAMIVEESGNITQARKLYEKILDINPGYALAYNNLGIIELNAENYGLGIKKLKLANKLDSKNEMIANNLEQAKKDRKERRWNRVMKGLETAQMALGVAATTYNTVEAVKGTNNFVDVNAIMSGATESVPSSIPASKAEQVSFTGSNNIQLAQEEEKLQQLLIERKMLLNKRTVMHQETSREGIRRTKRTGTYLKMNHGQMRPGQGNYGVGAAEKRSYDFSANKVELQNVDRRIAACRQRIRILREGEEAVYASSGSLGDMSTRSSSGKGISTGADQFNYNTDSNTYMKHYDELMSMKNRNGLYTNSTYSEINNARKSRQAAMKQIRERWAAKGKNMGNSNTIAMESWVP